MSDARRYLFIRMLLTIPAQADSKGNQVKIPVYKGEITKQEVFYPLSAVSVSNSLILSDIVLYKLNLKATR